jgi:predicted transcriptional regulator
MKTNHNWNVLNIMRFYNRLNKPYTAGVYSEFMYTRVDEREIQTIIRKYLKNGWCKRADNGLVITNKGVTALDKYNQTRREDYEDKMRELGSKGHEVKQELKARKRNKYGAFTK